MSHHRREFLPPMGTSKFSKSEVSILTLAHTGANNQEIADALKIKMNTVLQALKSARSKYRDSEQMKALAKISSAGAPHKTTPGGLVR